MKLELDKSCSIELIGMKHAAELFELVCANRAHLMAWLPWVNEMKNEIFIEKFIKGSFRRNAKGLEYAFVIVKNEKIVGRIGVYKIDLQNKIGEIGYWISEPEQGKGITRRCCELLIHFVFDRLQLNRIEIKCAAENLRSQLIPEALGFTFEGVQRQAEWNKEKFTDLKLYAFLRSEWELKFSVK